MKTFGIVWRALLCCFFGYLTIDCYNLDNSISTAITALIFLIILLICIVKLITYIAYSFLPEKTYYNQPNLSNSSRDLPGYNGSETKTDDTWYQSLPYGSGEYTQVGTDAGGNPILRGMSGVQFTLSSHNGGYTWSDDDDNEFKKY